LALGGFEKDCCDETAELWFVESDAAVVVIDLLGILIIDQRDEFSGARLPQQPGIDPKLDIEQAHFGKGDLSPRRYPDRLERDAIILHEDVRKLSILPRRRHGGSSWPETEYQIPFGVPTVRAFNGVRQRGDIAPAIIARADNAQIGQDSVFMTWRARPPISSLVYQI
jgi:hypothetical protein